MGDKLVEEGVGTGVRALLVKRSALIDRIAALHVASMSVEERRDLLIEWWEIDESDEEFWDLPVELRAEIENGDGSPPDAELELVDPLLIVATKHRFSRYRNAYLEDLGSRAGLDPVQVLGEEPTLAACPVCLYRSLDPPGAFEICEVCLWQNDGVRSSTEVSGANRMSLDEAKKRFAASGSIEGAESVRVLPADRFLRYARDVLG